MFPPVRETRGKEGNVSGDPASFFRTPVGNVTRGKAACQEMVVKGRKKMVGIAFLFLLISS
jgi:hypothetical protein